MNTKKLKIIMTIIIFLLAFPFHFFYDKFSNFIFSIFFPVNESIWEHMKLLFTSIIFSGVIEYIIIKKKDVKVNNYLLSLFIPAILSIPIYLIIFLPIYYKIGENFIITITIEQMWLWRNRQTHITICRSGGIGRRSGLKIRW